MTEIIGVILLYPKKGGRVRYPLVDNLLHQVIFFSYLTVSFSHYAIPTSYITVLLSHWVVPLLFSHTWRFHPHIVQFQHYMWQFFYHIWWFLYFFSHIWRFHSHIMQFQYHMWQFFSHIWWFSYFFFPHIWQIHPYIVQFRHHMWQFFSHIWWFPSFSSHLIVSFSHCVILTSHVTKVLISHVTVLLSHLMVSLLFFFTFDGPIPTKVPPNVRTIQLNVILVLSNVTIEPSFARKEKLNHQTWQKYSHMWFLVLHNLKMVPLNVRKNTSTTERGKCTVLSILAHLIKLRKDRFG